MVLGSYILGQIQGKDQIGQIGDDTSACELGVFFAGTLRCTVQEGLVAKGFR